MIATLEGEKEKEGLGVQNKGITSGFDKLVTRTSLSNMFTYLKSRIIIYMI